MDVVGDVVEHRIRARSMKVHAPALVVGAVVAVLQQNRRAEAAQTTTGITVDGDIRNTIGHHAVTRVGTDDRDVTKPDGEIGAGDLDQPVLSGVRKVIGAWANRGVAGDTQIIPRGLAPADKLSLSRRPKPSRGSRRREATKARQRKPKRSIVERATMSIAIS